MRKTVLVVDDEEYVCYYLKSALERQGFAVSTCLDGACAIQTAVKMKPNLILLDIKMPAKDGLTVLRELKSIEVCKDIPVIVLSAKNQLHQVREGLDLGASAYLCKPTHPDIIMETVLEWLK